MENNNVILVKYADGDEYHLTIEYLSDIAAARKRASELLRECANKNGEDISVINIENERIKAILTDGTIIWIYWDEIIKGGATYVNFSSDNFGDIVSFDNIDKAVEWMRCTYLYDYEKYAESIVVSELCTRPFSENSMGDFSKDGYYGYIICQDEDAEMYYKIIEY